MIQFNSDNLGVLNNNLISRGMVTETLMYTCITMSPPCFHDREKGEKRAGGRFPPKPVAGKPSRNPWSNG